MSRVISFISVSFLVVFTACGSASDSTMQLTEEDNGRTVELKVGETIEVALQGNPTTGYQWQVASIDTTVLSAVGEPEYTPDSDAIGSGGVFVFQFKALAAATTPLQLEYLRVWETDVPPTELFTLNVVIE
jgi:inhibitor of cysteine peptidase